MNTRIVIGLSLVLVGLTSCVNGAGPFRPAAGPAVRIDLTLSASATGGSSAEPLTLTPLIENLGWASVDVPNRCPIPLLRIYDAQGTELLLKDPTIPVVCTAEASRPFRPMGRYNHPITFNGRYYAPDGTALDARPGTYRAVATFVYVAHPEVRTLVREVTFTWH
ncbi:MAG TPA: hypothetical protein VJY35_10210 [Candidatus Eisenbacteria bacterium]|nr:hypothetical protein [Candidatus Eisenbacteria bacterium]